MSNQLTPGVIGGMGEATIDLMYRVFEQTSASDDSGHIRLLVDNNPKVPSRIKAIIEGTGESPAPCMVQMAQGLVSQGADFWLSLATPLITTTKTLQVQSISL